jgi:hypothetical protein
MKTYRIIGYTRQSHEIGTVRARSEEEAIKKAERELKEELARAAKRCYRTGQLHDISAREEK